jgi:PKD repeat protein
MVLIPMIVGIIVFISLYFVGGAENKPPVASFTYSPPSPSTADTIQFTDTSTDPDGTIVGWSWAFGDGSPTSTSQNPTHQYTTAGAYTATLTVTDDGGVTDECSKVINVSMVAPSEGMFQNFEEGNGTPGAYFQNVWQTSPSFDTSTVHEGARSLKMIALDTYGGTMRVNAASPTGYFDLRDATSFSVWVYDTQDSNTIQLRLKDSNGDGGSGSDNYSMWSSMSAVKNTWTKITWDLNDYPTVPNLDWDRIASIELYEWNPGTYYFDNVNFL